MWVSARDIDLLQEGPKSVSPRVVSTKDVANAVVDLLEPAEKSDKGFNALNFFETCMSQGAAGRTLFVIDNFETVETPADVFSWFDAHIRTPNKVLITTRFREFAGDYPIVVEGMTEKEALALIDQESRRLGVSGLLNTKYTQALIRESDGHPYVMKILLGRVADEGKAVAPERIVAGADRILKALFERTYTSLSPAAQRTFILLSSWRVMIPEVAVEAVSLRPGNERFDIRDALDELRRFSLVEEIVSEADGELFIGVPLAASIFGSRKLEVSPFKIAVEEDRRLLMEFGAGKREDAHHGVAPRAHRLVSSIAQQISEGALKVDDAIPILEYMAAKVPVIFLQLAELHEEAYADDDSLDRAIEYLRRYLEVAEPRRRTKVWLWVADLCGSKGDVLAEVHALTEAALGPEADVEIVGEISNRLNNRIRELKGQRIEDAWSIETRQMIGRFIETMEGFIKKLNATECSRLAWLYLNVGNELRARDVTQIGLKKDPLNHHCLNLADKLNT